MSADALASQPASRGSLPRPDCYELGRCSRALCQCGELRTPHSTRAWAGPGPWRASAISSGWFDSSAPPVDAVFAAIGRNAEAVYLTLNRLPPGLFARRVSSPALIDRRGGTPSGSSRRTYEYAATR